MPWSDWQDYGDKTFTLGAIHYNGANRQAFGYPPYSGDTDVAVFIEAQRAAIVAGTYDSETAPLFSYVGFQIEGIKGNEGSVQTTAVVQLMQTALALPGSNAADDLDPFPPLLNTLVEGVDFDFNEDVGAFVQYESDTSTFVRWEDVDVWMQQQIQQDLARGQNSGYVSDIPLTVPEFDILVYGTGDIRDVNWNAAAPGALIDTLVFHPTDNVTGSPGGFGFSVENATLHMGSVTDEDTTVVFQTAYIDADPLPVSDYPMPPSGYTDLLLSRAVAILAGDAAGAAAQIPSFPTFQITYTLPRFQYWIPENKLRTIGDHFRSVGGAQIKSLVNGEWVPVRRGT